MYVFYLMSKIDKEIRDAVWQYFMDHSQLQTNGFWRIDFGVEDEEDFWRRVQARKDGDYVRADIDIKNYRQQEFQSILLAKKISDKINARRQEKIKQIKERGSLWEKLLLKTYRISKNKIFKGIK